MPTLVERGDGFLAGGKCRRKTAECVERKLPAALKGQKVFTVTLGRGKEFARHALITGEIGIGSCFALPHHPWRHGTSENNDGLLREYFPKGESLVGVTKKRVRKPYEVRYSTVLQLT